jgi:3-phenylpropionate/trans-cinnamate dioxygenase ferredoxin subunit
MSAVDVAAEADVAPGSALLVQVEGTPVALVNVEGTIHAVHDTCTHARESLSDGYVDEDRIECPRHGAFFSVVTGEALTPPATRALPTFPVEIRDGRILVSPEPSHPHPLPDR